MKTSFHSNGAYIDIQLELTTYKKVLQKKFRYSFPAYILISLILSSKKMELQNGNMKKLY